MKTRYRNGDTLFLAIIIAAFLVVFCAFLYTLNLTTMARFDAITFEKKIQQAVPTVPHRREAWV